MHPPSLQDILVALEWVAGGVGVVYLSGYASKAYKSHTRYDQQARRVVLGYWASFCLWQICLALGLPAMHSSWIHYAGPLLIVMIFLFVILFPLIQAGKREKS